MPEQDQQSSELLSQVLYSSQFPQVIFEEEDHEVVVVNLLEGTYYYLTGTAAFTWISLHSGLTVGQVAQAIEIHTNASAGVSKDIEGFVLRLMELGLVAPVVELPGDSVPTPDVRDYLDAEYQVPVIETYSDLQDILLLDPVHDVDESGWPTPRKP